jgi:hypothetical protein
MLLRVLYTVRRERLLDGAVDDDLLFRGLWGLPWMTPTEFHVTDRPSPDRTFCRAMPVQTAAGTQCYRSNQGAGGFLGIRTPIACLYGAALLRYADEAHSLCIRRRR